METNFCTVTPDIYVSSVWNLLQVTILAPRILRWLLYLKKQVRPCNTCFGEVGSFLKYREMLQI